MKRKYNNGEKLVVLVRKDYKMGLDDWAEVIHKNAREHGFWNGENNFAEKIALIHAELSEAIEAHRAGDPMLYCKIGSRNGNPVFCRTDNSICPRGCRRCEGCGKPEGVAVELIDALIRLLDLCAAYRIDVERVVRMKHEYNQTRPYKHGKAY